MKRIAFFIGILLLCASCCREEVSDVPYVIFETDMGNDVDDALALDMLYKYMDAGRLNLAGIMLNKEGTASAEFIDIMGTYYGYPDIPVGVVRNGAPDNPPGWVNYAKAVVDMKAMDGTPLFVRSRGGYEAYPDAHILYRKLLSEAPDSSVTIISVGFSTNLARLLDTPADEYSPLTGRELVARKVKLLSNMAGNMVEPKHPEYNVVKDIPAARKVFSEWPTSIVTSPFELGLQVEYPGASIENDFSWAGLHPMVEAYKAFQPMPYDRPTWDLTSVLYVMENGPEFFAEPLQGRIEIDEQGFSSFIPGEGNHFLLHSDSLQLQNIRERFVSLISEPLER